MQQIDSSDIEKKDLKFPFITISVVFIIIISFYLLWRPLNPERTIYIPLTPQVQTTVIENHQLPSAVGNATIVRLDDRVSQEQQPEESLDQPKPEDDVIKDEIDEVIDQDDNSVQYTVNRGDTLSGILTQYGVNRNDVYLLTKQFKQLTNLRIGQQISWTVDTEHNLKSLCLFFYIHLCSIVYVRLVS